MKNFLIALVVIIFTNCDNLSAQSVGCPTNCQNTQTCQNSECLNGICVAGWWGRKCEHPLECQIRNNKEAYRGTKHVTKTGKNCTNWTLYSSKNPPDGPKAKNYCRKADNDDYLWCYPANEPYEKCDIAFCDKQCPAPDVQPHSIVTDIPPNGFAVNSTIKVECAVGYEMQCDCEPLECLIRSDNGKHYRGTQDVTSDGTSCIKWNTQGSDPQFETPPDRPDHNYCRHVQNDGQPGTWCYTSKVKPTNKNRWGPCNITFCDNSVLLSQGNCSIGLYRPNNSIRCLSNKKWSTPFPKCIARCNKPQVKQHSCIAMGREIYKYNEVLEVRCDTGYETKDNRYFICQDNTQWNGTVPTCSAVHCKIPTLYNHSYTNNLSNPAYNQTITIRCGDGYVIQGHSTLTCQSDKTFDAPPPRCNAICSTPILNEHSEIVNKRQQYNESDVLEIKCDMGYETTNKTHFVCQNDKMWNGSMPQCNIIHCKLPNLYNHSSFVNSMSIPAFNDVITISCDAGYQNANEKNTFNLKCRADKRWDKVPPVCLATCHSPFLKVNSHIINETDRFRYRDIITISCDQGYETSDQTHLVCQDNRHWSSSTPSCLAISCRVTKLNPHSRTANNITSVEYTESITIMCDEGYYMKGNDILNCQADKTWDWEFPFCEAVCDPPKLKDNSEIKSPSTQYKFKDKVNVSCETGYETNDTTERICQDDRTWSLSSPTCSAITCVVPRLSNNSRLEINAGEVTYLRTITVLCNDGYLLKGNGTLLCQANKTWNHKMPICEAICDPPTLKDNSEIKNQATQYKFKDKVNVSCKSGYETNDTTELICQNDRTWSLSSTTCSAITCVVPKLNNNSRLETHVSKVTYLNTITVVCDDGYILKGNRTLRCQANKKWNHIMPLCEEKPKQLADKSSGSNAGAIGGGIGAVVVVIVIIVIIVVVIKRRTHDGKRDEMNSITSRAPKMEMYPASHHSKENVYENENKPSSTYANADSVNDAMYYDFSPGQSPTKNAIKVDAVAEYARRKVAERETLEADYETFKSGLQMSVDEAEKSRNRKKNKYRSIYPYDDNRVTLRMLPRQPDSDYINASYINGCGNFRKYIASQGPIKPSVDDFWRMIWELNIKKVVMLTNIFEEGKEKCVKYWPDEGNISFGETDITLEKEDIFCDYTIRELSVHKNGERKDVVQYHFTAWPDKGVPKSGSTLITLRNLVFGGDLHQEIPTLVHCSAGIGRTGTFIALDFLIDQANITGFVDFYECVVTLRRQRVNMVQTKDQYVFLHEIIAEALVYSDTGVMSSEFADEYKSLIHKDKIRTLYETLQNTTPQIDEKEYKTGKAQANKRKNRLSNIIPVDSERPYISVDEEGGSYINAVFLPSTRDHRAFIVTQMPLQETLSDFWKLIWEHDAQSIVMLNGTLDESTGTYLPSSGKPLTFGSFAVTLKETETYKFGTASTLSVRHGKENRTVKQFKYALWSDKSTVPEEALPLLDLIKIVQSDKQSGPIVVYCLNGVEKSGVYCTLANAVQQISDDQEIDIPKIIRRLRLSRPQIIPNLEQFRFCYDAVMEYLNQFSTYQNI